MYVCMYKGWAIKLALALRPLMIYCASPLAAAMIITVAALRIVLAHGSLLAACFTLQSSCSGARSVRTYSQKLVNFHC
jgi:hypothetical protein